MTTRCVGGTIFPHLRATRQLILWLSKPANRPSTEEDHLVYGFVLELYSFLVLKNTFTPYGLIESRTIPYDPMVRSLGSLACYPTFGVRFFGLHGLFELIAPVSELAARRLEDETPGAKSSELEATYGILEAKIMSWRRPADAPLDSLGSTVLHTLGETYRYALLVFLETAMAGSVVRDPDTRAKIQEFLDVLASYLLGYDREHGTYEANLGWPIMIGGSCLEDPDLRTILLDRLRSPRQDSVIPTHTSKLLELLWEDDDERAFGPYGIYFIMKKHGMNFGFS
ncbi:hypothetical protein GQ53DRAFT_141366 [Thozetella sp. PMI_491]|nr:hypothetical protein GQ53DRAFT_141366 [Thozetella sp. PMI_491]